MKIILKRTDDGVEMTIPGIYGDAVVFLKEDILLDVGLLLGEMRLHYRAGDTEEIQL